MNKKAMIMTIVFGICLLLSACGNGTANSSTTIRTTSDTATVTSSIITDSNIGESTADTVSAPAKAASAPKSSSTAKESTSATSTVKAKVIPPLQSDGTYICYKESNFDHYVAESTIFAVGGREHNRTGYIYILEAYYREYDEYNPDIQIDMPTPMIFGVRCIRDGVGYCTYHPYSVEGNTITVFGCADRFQDPTTPISKFEMQENGSVKVVYSDNALFVVGEVYTIDEFADIE